MTGFMVYFTSAEAADVELHSVVDDIWFCLLETNGGEPGMIVHYKTVTVTWHDCLLAKTILYLHNFKLLAQ